MKLQPWVKAEARDAGRLAWGLLAAQGVLGYLDRGIPAGDLAILGVGMIVVHALMAWAKARRAAKQKPDA